MVHSDPAPESLFSPCPPLCATEKSEANYLQALVCCQWRESKSHRNVQNKHLTQEAKPNGYCEPQWVQFIFYESRIVKDLDLSNNIPVTHPRKELFSVVFVYFY